jgi:hypothetical protein
MGCTRGSIPAGLPVVCTVIGPAFRNFRVFERFFLKIFRRQDCARFPQAAAHEAEGLRARYSPDRAFQRGYVQSVAILSYLPGGLLKVQAGSVRERSADDNKTREEDCP